MIITSCYCNKPHFVGYECGDKMGHGRVDCECGKILLVELNSFGETTIFNNEKEFNDFLNEKGLIKKCTST